MSVIKGVYCLTSPSGKRYVGIGMGKDGIKARWDSYRKLRCKQQRKLYNALKKYGPENFKYEVILETDDADNANRSEMYLIDVWNLQDDRYGYNMTDGGDTGSRGNKWSEESRRKKSESMKGKPGVKGRKWNEESRHRLSIAKKGKPGVRLGCKLSEEQKIKMSEMRKGKKATQKQYEHILRMTKARIGVPRSEETKRKIGLANSNMSKENRLIASLRLKKYLSSEKFQEFRKKQQCKYTVKNIDTDDIIICDADYIKKELKLNCNNLRHRGYAGRYILVNKEKSKTSINNIGTN